MRSIIPVILLVLVAGCKKSLDVYETKKPTVVASTSSDGTLLLSSRELSSDTLFVTGIVQRVTLPLLNSPSIAGDNASCLLLVPAHSIPARPDFSSVVLHYDNHGWLRGLKVGHEIILRFHKDGEFEGVQFTIYN